MKKTAGLGMGLLLSAVMFIGVISTKETKEWKNPLPENGTDQLEAPTQSDGRTLSGTISPTIAPTPTPQPKLVTNKVSAASPFQAGANTVIYDNPDDYKKWTVQHLERLVDLNVNTAVLVIPLFQENWRSTSIRTDSKKTPSVEMVTFFVREAKKRGFFVTLRPLLDEESFIPDGQWRGSIQPVSKDAWFESYWKYLSFYAQIAETEHVDVLSIGTEFSSLEFENSWWTTLIERTRNMYKGQITYSTNWDPKYANFPLESTPWKRLLDFESIDAYFELDAPAIATLEQLIVAWQKWIPIIESSGRQMNTLVFSEIGVIARTGSHRIPYAWSLPGEENQEEQRLYYESVCSVFKPTIRGVLWWFVDLTIPEEATWQQSLFNPLGKSAESEIKKCFAP